MIPTIGIVTRGRKALAEKPIQKLIAPIVKAQISLARIGRKVTRFSPPAKPIIRRGDGPAGKAWPRIIGGCPPGAVPPEVYYFMYQNSLFESSMMLIGPSLTAATDIMARNWPFFTTTPDADSFSLSNS
jgi:hypothetical protein